MSADCVQEVTKVKPARGDHWPEGRDNHAACCLNCGEAHPVVLVYGGLGTDYSVRGDMWILDVDTGKWSEVKMLQVPLCEEELNSTKGCFPYGSYV